MSLRSATIAWLRRIMVVAGACVAVAFFLASVLVLVLVPVPGASAHNYLVESSPASGAVQTEALTQVSLRFSDRVLDLSGDGSSAIVQVTDTSGRQFGAGCPSILDRTVSVPVALGTAGAYTVEWQVVSADGHTVSGSYGFEYRPAADVAPALGSVVAPECEAGASSADTEEPSAGTGTPLPSATVATSSATVPYSGDGGLGLAIGIGVAIVVLALVGVVILLVTSRRRRPDTEP